MKEGWKDSSLTRKHEISENTGQENLLSPPCDDQVLPVITPRWSTDSTDGDRGIAQW